MAPPRRTSSWSTNRPCPSARSASTPSCRSCSSGSPARATCTSGSSGWAPALPREYSHASGTRSRRLSRVWPRRTTRSSGRPSTQWPPFATATTSPRSRPPPDPRTCERSWAGRWTGAGNSALHDLVTDFFRRHSAEYELRAQLCVDVDRMPIEDASVLWPEELSPHHRVAVLHLPAQDPYSDARRRYADDVLSFSPWN